MIYPPRKEMKISLRTPQSDSISLCLPISKCQLISQARPPSWTPNTANCSFLCIPSAKQHINWDEEIAWSFPGLYFFCTWEKSEEACQGSFVEKLWNWSSEDLNKMGRKGRWVIEAQPCVCVGCERWWVSLDMRNADSSLLPSGIHNTTEFKGALHCFPFYLFCSQP